MEGNDAFRVLGFKLTLVFLFFRLSLIHELIAAKLGINTYVLYITGVPAIGALLFAGGLRRSFSARAMWFWAAFCACIAVGAPFSLWPGASVLEVLGFMRTELMTGLLIAGMVLTWGEVTSLMNVFAMAALVNIAIGKLLSGDAGGRLQLDVQGGVISNSNDYAAHLTLMIPFLLIVVFTKRRAFLVRAGALLFCFYALYLILSTGSRGGSLALIAGVLYGIARMPARYRIIAAVALPIGAGAVFAALPSETADRLASLFKSEPTAAAQTDEAAASAENRSQLLKRSIELTFQHPVLGVGMGQFQIADGAAARAEGHHGLWHETHNAYTQVSSETGIPALLFYLAALVSTFIMLNRLLRNARRQQPTPENQTIIIATLCVLLSLTMFSVAITFLSLAYRFYLPAFTGLAIAMTRAANRQWNAAAAVVPARSFR
ncbi:MAG TPA: O-antigen ligase family protein [Bryobacteraceae bacterium]|nr:O-antigen ligase family protein [Bryobacteraceae bacterium]